MDVTLDTNVIIRFLVGDDRAHQQQAIRWFKEAEAGKYRIEIKSLVIAEAVFVLESVYRLGREAIASSLRTFISQPWFEVEEREILLVALSSYGELGHFVDQYLIGVNTIDHLDVLTFDKELKRRLAHNY